MKKSKKVLFFVLVFLLMNVGQRKPLLLKNYDDNRKNSFNVGYLTNKNYNFTYNFNYRF